MSMNTAEIGTVTTKIGQITMTQKHFLQVYNPTENVPTYGISFRCAWHIDGRQVYETDTRNPVFNIATKEEAFNLGYEYMMSVENLTSTFKASSLFGSSEVAE
jgi:hypothetical protein